MGMIEVKIGGLVPDRQGRSHILLLKVPTTSKYLPIWIGAAEATSIAVVLRGQEFDRPLSHDLMRDVVLGLGASVERVVITSLREGTFFARLVLQRDGEIISVDARPSDCIALALRVPCPVFVTDELLQSQLENLVEVEEADAAALSAEAGASAAASGDSPTSPISEQSLRDLMRSVEQGRPDMPDFGGPSPADEDEED
jgi:uncharacterized protein